MNPAVIGFPAAILVAFLLGLALEPSLDTSAIGRASAAPKPPSTLHPRDEIGFARERLAQSGVGFVEAATPLGASPMGAMPLGVPAQQLAPLPAQPDAESEPRPERPPPPPVDIADRLGSELSAVVRGAGGSTLLLVDPAAPSGRRTVGPGQTYREGWRLQGVDGAYIVLRRGKAFRRIPISRGAPPPQQMVLAPAQQPQPTAVEPAAPTPAEAPPNEAETDDVPAPDPAAQPPPETSPPERPRRRITRGNK